MRNIDDVEYHRSQFIEQGFTVISSQISDAESWREKILQSPHLKHVYVSEEKRKVEAGKGSLRYAAIDRYQIDLAVKELNSYYINLVEPLRIITNQDIITSPFERTAYYAKVYRNKGDEQGWHYDTNGLTVIIYLTDNLTSGRTEIENLKDGASVFIQPRAGSILVMQGRKCWHRAEPILSGTKVICPLNYYVGKVEDRDPRLDDIIFGNV